MEERAWCEEFYEELAEYVKKVFGLTEKEIRQMKKSDPVKFKKLYIQSCENEEHEACVDEDGGNLELAADFSDWLVTI